MKKAKDATPTDETKTPSPVREFAKLLSIPAIILLLIAAYVYIPRALANPGHDFIYSACEDYRCSNSYTVERDGSVSETSSTDQGYGNSIRTLYHYDISEDATRKISLEEAQAYKLNSLSKSPDGYKLKHESSGGGFFLFYGYDSSWVLADGAKKKSLDIQGNQYYYSDNIQLVGWGRVMDKTTLLEEINIALANNVITPAELQASIPELTPDPPITTPMQNGPQTPEAKHHLSAVDTMFYVGGIILFIALTTLIAQSWSDSSPAVHVSMSAGVGSLLWALAYYITKGPEKPSEITTGLSNSLILTGSLSLIVGGYVIMNELLDGFEDLNLLPAALMLLLLGVIHYAYDTLMKNQLVIAMSTLLFVLVFPTAVFGILGTAISPDVAGLTVIATAALLAKAGRVMAFTGPDRTHMSQSFDAFAVFVALASAYILSYGSEAPIIWQLILPVAILGVFFLSITSKSRDFLKIASLFTILFLVTVSFRYFSGTGPVFSLAISAFSVIGTAMMASNISKKFNQ